MTATYPTPIDSLPYSTYVVPATFDTALKVVRDMLLRDNLLIPAEIDMSGRIRQVLGIHPSAPCRLLLVDSHSTLLYAAERKDVTAFFLPLHVLVTGQGPRTLISVLTRPGSPLLAQLAARVVRTLEKISLRQAA